MAHRFEIVREIMRVHRLFGTNETQYIVGLNQPNNLDLNPVDHFLTSVSDLFEHVLQDVQDSDKVGVAIRNEANQIDMPIGITFRRREQISGDEISSAFEKVPQSYSRFNALDTLTIELHAVKMPVRFGRIAMKTQVRPIQVMAHLKRSLREVKTETNCLAHALIIAITKITKYPNYKAYVQGRKIHPVIHNLLAMTGINLSNGGIFRNYSSFGTISTTISSLFIQV